MAYQAIRLRDLEKTTAAIAAAVRQGHTKNTRPAHGWLRAVREALGLSFDDVAKKARMPRQHIGRFEKYEVMEKITLASLRRVAEAMDCELVYVVLPKRGTFTELANKVAREKSARVVMKAREQAMQLVHDVDHTMALEGQSTGRVKERIEEETQRILKRRKNHSFAK